ncbi:MAG: peptidoglycan DD-metalloendopeptidase family protein [Thiohalocapsa sp.]
MSDLLRWGSGAFPDRLSFKSGARRVVIAAAAHRRTLALSAAAALGVSSSVYFAACYVRYERLAAVDHAVASRTASANADLQDALARMRDELGTATQALTAAQSRVSALNDETKRQLASTEQAVVSKADRIAQLTHALEQAQRELHLAEAQRVTMLARLTKAEAELSERLLRQQQAQAGLEQWQKKIQQLTAERDKAASERDQLRHRVGELEKHSLQTRPPAAPVAQAVPRSAAPAPIAAAPVAAAPAASPSVAAAAPPAAVAAAPAAPSRTAPAQQVAVVQPPPAVAPAAPAPQPVVAPPPHVVPAVASGTVAQFERVLASAGVDVTHLFAQYGVRGGLGGPFVPVPRGGPPALSAEKLAALEQLVRALPISAPLESYRIGSPFGIRGDPINAHREFHTGVDFLAPYMSPVYATAPGVVAYSGYRDDYGKVVEIDHGHGISTRYAHLHRQLVSVGQRVAAHQQIGYLGSTGRATGPHVHYEVLVNGEPQDPEKFLGLARLVQVAHHY